MLNFKDCTLATLDKKFTLEQIRPCPFLEDWLVQSAEISEIERHVLLVLQESAQLHIHDWDEHSLKIGP